MNKSEIIEKVYNDFYGTIKQTYEEAKKIEGGKAEIVEKNDLLLGFKFRF